MRFIIRGSLILFFLGVLFCPFFAFASTKCYVDEKQSENGDGSQDNPFKNISKAIEENCEIINVEEGNYDEHIDLKKGAGLKGADRDKVIITGSLTMFDNSAIEKITIKSGGIDIIKNADVEINNVKIEGAPTGIDTEGGGKIVVNKSIIVSNGKGIYIQKGANIKITNCKVNNNSEEGLDIRADVSGSIGENEIYDNKESGIEVILGKASLVIYNNKIKNNSSSGIATQFYDDFNDLGNVNIKNNTISGNANYGIDCRASSGGDTRPKGYWLNSMTLSANNISGNKKNDFASSCKFNADQKADAAKTKEEKESERLALEKKEQSKTISVEEQKKLEILAKEKAEEERLVHEEQEAQRTIETISEEVGALFEVYKTLEDKIRSRNSFVTFLIGPDYKEIKKINDELSVYDEKINAAEDRKMAILSESGLNEANEKISLMRENKNELSNFAEAQGERFGILGWLFKKVYLSEEK